MSQEEIKQLEVLLVKFESHLGHRYCIAYPVIQDGFHIGIYDNNGEMIKSECSYDIRSTADKIKKKT